MNRPSDCGSVENVWIAIADTHLRVSDKEKEDRLLKLLDRYSNSMSGLILLGDIFDVWLGYRHGIFFQAIGFLAKLRELALKGVSIVYLEGNHDFSLQGFFETYIGAQTGKSIEIDLFGKKIYASHGDEFNFDKIDYRITRALMSSRLMQFFVSLIPLDICFWLFNTFSCLSRKFSREKSFDTGRYIQNVKKLACGKNIDYILTAHNHLRMDKSIECDQKSIRILNPGFFDDKLHFILITKDCLELKSFDPESP